MNIVGFLACGLMMLISIILVSLLNAKGVIATVPAMILAGILAILIMILSHNNENFEVKMHVM